ncbi:hypothetical protein [Actinoplanes sp. N902-109]|uniref:hypothetical protein n=1 Tax=Actinoplanes sp. (strain N902-109) TaxID=649831 RepID=UPI0003296188|nr:hypothetical protein [Actinoplanes sp. N902-109]AGL19521.1 hypothetical protein L083_6011 [Actinoplanes sp. N902-109]
MSADAQQLEPTKVLVALLADVDNRRVLTSEHDFGAYLELPSEEPADVGTALWAMERAGWVRQPTDSLVWELTGRGREVLDRGAP